MSQMTRHQFVRSPACRAFVTAFALATLAIAIGSLAGCSIPLIFPCLPDDPACHRDMAATPDMAKMPDMVQVPDLVVVPDLRESVDLVVPSDLAPQCNGRFNPPAVYCGPDAKPGDPCDDGLEITPSESCGGPNGLCVGFRVPYVNACRTDADCCGPDTVTCPKTGGDLRAAYFPTGKCVKGACEIAMGSCPDGTVCTPNGCM